MQPTCTYGKFCLQISQQHCLWCFNGFLSRSDSLFLVLAVNVIASPKLLLTNKYIRFKETVAQAKMQTLHMSWECLSCNEMVLLLNSTRMLGRG